MPRPPRLAVYASGHGLGHSARAIGVVNALPKSLEVVVSTWAPRWFWEGELTRPVGFRERKLDCGSLQKDTLRSDGPGTLEAFLAQDAKAEALIEEEIAFLRSVGAKGVLTDVPSIPLVAARELGIPAILLCNFTWADIYRPYIDAHPEGARFEAAFARMVERYSSASLILKTPLSMAMSELRGLPEVKLPLVCRRLSPRRINFRSAMGIDPRERVLLVSAGLYGAGLDYGRLSRLKGVRCVSFNAPEAAQGDILSIPYPTFRSQDVTDMVDGVVAKAGYGTLAECMSTGTPLIYPPREGFAEHEVLVDAMERWGGGVGISTGEFEALDLRGALECLEGLGPLAPMPHRGAEVGAEAILKSLELESLHYDYDSGEASHRKGWERLN